MKTLFSWQLLLAQLVSFCAHGGRKDGKDAGFCARCRVTGWLGPRCRQFLYEGTECCKALLQVWPFANKKSSRQFCFHLKGARERESEIFFNTQPSSQLAGRQVVQWDKRPIYVPNGKLMLLGNSEHVQRMASQTQRHPRPKTTSHEFAIMIIQVRPNLCKQGH